MQKKKASGPTTRPFVGSALHRAPQGVMFGDVGSGKTTELLRAFRHWDIYLPDPTSLARAESLGITPKTPIELVDTYDENSDGHPIVVPRWDLWMLRIHKDYAAKAKARREKWKAEGKNIKDLKPIGYVLTDASELWEWIWRDICAVIPHTGRGMFRRLERIKWIAAKSIKLAKAYDFGLIWEMHKTEKTYVELEDGQDPAMVPNLGEEKWPGGPKFPVGSMIRGVLRKLDFAHELVNDDETTRVIVRPDGSGKAIIKTRREVEMSYELTKDFNYRHLLSQMKFHV